MSQIAKYLILGGGILIFIGILILFRDRIPFLKTLGFLPGDIRIEKESFKLYFPVTTSLVLSLILSLAIMISTLRIGGKNVDAGEEAGMIEYEQRTGQRPKVSLPKSDEVIDLETLEKSKPYLSRDELLSQLHLYIPSSGSIQFEEKMQAGRFILKNGQVLHFFIPSAKSLYLVPEGHKKEDGQLFLKANTD